MDLALSVGGIYLFILLGFFGKLRFGERLHERTLVLISIYLLQPMLVFWGLTRAPIDRRAVEAPLLFVGFILLFLLLVLPLVHRLFRDPKERSVAVVSSIIGNTGNLGIPLGIALFGESSVLYTSIINLANVFLVYTVGVYFYSRGNFSVRESLLNILRLPPIWFGVGAIAFNLVGGRIPKPLELPLEMGAYATMVLQLLIFGIYLATVRREAVHRGLALFVMGAKFVAIPLLAWMLLPFWASDPLLFNVLLLELIVPMAVMNVNLAALYDCRPDQVALLTFLTSVVFLAYLFAMSSWAFR
ncbi:AEC family transporter [Nitratifractor sp.]